MKAKAQIERTSLKLWSERLIQSGWVHSHWLMQPLVVEHQVILNREICMMCVYRGPRVMLNVLEPQKSQ